MRIKNFSLIVFIILLFIYCCTINSKIDFLSKINQSFYDTNQEEISFSYNANVYIYPTDDKKKQNIQKAFKQWEDVTDGAISFQEVNEIGEAGITIKYVDEFSIKRNQSVIGFTSINIFGYGTPDGSEEKEYFHAIEILNDETSVSTIVHELGHAIGLRDHSDLSSSIMHSYKRFSQKLSEEDILRAKLLPLSKNGKDKDSFSNYYTFNETRKYYINTCNQEYFNLQECELAKSVFENLQIKENIKEANIDEYTTNSEISDVDINFVDTIEDGSQLGHIYYDVINGRLYITIEIARRGMLSEDNNQIVTLSEEQKKDALIKKINNACGVF